MCFPPTSRNRPYTFALINFYCQAQQKLRYKGRCVHWVLSNWISKSRAYCSWRSKGLKHDLLPSSRKAALTAGFSNPCKPYSWTHKERGATANTEKLRKNQHAGELALLGALGAWRQCHGSAQALKKRKGEGVKLTGGTGPLNSCSFSKRTIG